MDTYLVGGAVRDELLDIPVKDRDWVVVGTTPESMTQAGYKAVGRDFPVFLHPESHEEYALARTERKTGPGYHGFQFNTDVSVTLEEDLLRRDLTINAIAKTADGKLIDPFNGQQDITDKVLRHVSPAFVEDPVRVLRIAKFMARFAHLGFTLAEETEQLVNDMVSSGEVDNLVAERVWQELSAALECTTPRAFFDTLLATNAIDRIMPELKDTLSTRPALAALTLASELDDDTTSRFAALCVMFSPAQAAVVEQFCQRLRVPNAATELALLAVKHTELAHQALELNAEQIHSLLKSLDVSRRPDRFQQFLALAKVHASLSDTNEKNGADDYPQATHLSQCAEAMTSIDAASIAKNLNDRSAIPAAIKAAEIAAITRWQ